jgi:hypothetical protein
MATVNPFDLGSPVDDAEVDTTAMSEEDQLKGFIELEPKYWKYITLGTFVRYRSKDKEKVKLVGGTVTKGHPGCLTLRFGYPKSAGYKIWSVRISDIENIYQRTDAATLMVMSQMGVLWDNMVVMKDQINALAKRR